MRKRFKGKTCVYCGVAPSTTTGDHVFAREFFINVRRGNLPKVPACEGCNHEKSKLEHYLTAVLPFGGRHTDSAQNLSTLVEPRLAKNAKLYGVLSACAYRKSHPAILMVQSAQDRTAKYTPCPLYGAR